MPQLSQKGTFFFSILSFSQSASKRNQWRETALTSEFIFHPKRKRFEIKKTENKLRSARSDESFRWLSDCHLQLGPGRSVRNDGGVTNLDHFRSHFGSAVVRSRSETRTDPSRQPPSSKRAIHSPKCTR